MFDDLLSPDLQAVLAFLLPALAALSILTMTVSRGKSIEGIVGVVFFTAVAIYFLPGLVAIL